MDVMTVQDGIMELGEFLGRKRVINMALNWEAHSSNEHGYRYVWEVISYDADAAAAYYVGLDEEAAFTEAAEALAMAGWTRQSIAFRIS